jgi:phenylalanine-4-hydroxylase
MVNFSPTHRPTPSKLTASRDAGLTTGRAPFVERAQARGDLFITQPWEEYSAQNHETWSLLYRRMQEPWARFANARFLEGLDALALPSDRVPRLEEVNRFLDPLTGFSARPVAGYVPAFLFFDCLERREFPTTITVRDGADPDYLPEPDLFHDIAGHVPMHTDRSFAEALVQFGRVSKMAVHRLAEEPDSPEMARRLASNLRAMARFFWFTVEFGLMRAGSTGGEFKVYGSGLLSSYSELSRSVLSPEVQRFPFQLEWVVNQAFEIDHFQPLLFIIEDFEHLFAEVQRLEQWILEGRLDHVAPGEPAIASEEMEYALLAARERRLGD